MRCLMSDYKTLKKQLYARLPQTFTATKVYNQSGMQDLTLNPVYRGPVYDPIGIVRKQTVQREAAKRAYDSYVQKKQREQQAKANSLTDVAWDILSGDFASIGEWLTGYKDAFWNPEEGVTFGNFLMYLGNQAIEDLDVLANPIKGLLIDGVEGLKNATVGDQYGIRHNYNYDIKPGSYWDGPVNLVLEVALDPVNWFFFGGKAALSTGVKGLMSSIKSILKSSADDVIDVAITAGKKIGAEVVDDVAEEAIEKGAKAVAKDVIITLPDETLTKTYTKVSRENFEAVVERTIKEASDIIKKDTYKKASKRVITNYGKTVDVVEQVWVKNAVETGLLDEATARTVGARLKEKILAKNMYDTSYEVLKGVKGFARFGEALDSGIFKTAMFNSGPLEIWALAKWGYNKTSHTALVKAATEAYGRATAFGAKHWHRFKNHGEYLDFVAREFNGDPQLKSVIEAMGKDPASIDFHSLLGYKLDTEASGLYDFIRQLDPEDSYALTKLDAFINKTYGYKTYKEFVGNMNALPKSALQYAEDSFDKLNKAYGWFVDKYSIAKGIRTGARRAELGKAIDSIAQVVRAQDDIIAELIPAIQHWRKTGDFSQIHAVRDRVLNDISGVTDAKKFVDLVDEDAAVAGDLLSNINGVNTRTFVDDVPQNVDNAFKDLENRLKAMPDKQRAMLRKPSNIAEYTKQWYNNAINIDRLTRLTDYFEKYSQNYQTLMHNQKKVSQVIQKAMKENKRKQRAISKALRSLSDLSSTSARSVSETVEVIDVIVHSLEFQEDFARCIETFKPVDAVHQVAREKGALITEADINKIYSPVSTVDLYTSLQDWETKAPRLLAALKENPTEGVARQLIDCTNSVINALESAILKLSPASAKAELVQKTLIDFKQLRKELGNDFTARVVDLEIANKLYRTKVEEVYNVMTFMEDTDITDTLRIIATGTGNAKSPYAEFAYNMHRYIKAAEGTVLPEAEAEVFQAVKRIEAMATKYIATVDLYDDIGKLIELGIIDTQQANSILSTLQTFSMGGKHTALTCSAITNDFDLWFNDVLMEKVQMHHIEAFKRVQPLRQEALFETYKAKGILEKYGIDLDRYTHRAVDDAGTTRIVLNEELADEFNEYLVRNGFENYDIVCIDIETNGFLENTPFNKNVKFRTGETLNSPEVFEIGTQTIEAGKFSDVPVSKEYLRQYGSSVDANIPDAGVMNVIGDPKLSSAEKVNAFKAKHSGPAETIKDYYTRFLNDLLAKGDNVVLVSFNGDAFDMKALVHQFNKVGVDINLVDRFVDLVEKQHYDAYIALRQKLGYYTFTEDATNQIKRAISDYLQQNGAWKHIDDTAFKLDMNYFTEATVLDGITDSPFYSKFQIPKEFKDLIISKKASLKAQADELSYVVDSTVFKKLYVSASGKFLTWDEFSKNKVAVDVFTHLADAYAPEIGSRVLNQQTYEALCKLFGTDPNLSTMLFRTSGIVNPVGYKKVVDVGHVRTWFDLGDKSWKTGAEWTTDELANLEQLVYDIEAGSRHYKKHRHTTQIDPNIAKERIALYQQECLQLDSAFEDSALMHVRLDTQSVSELLAIEELYNKKLMATYEKLMIDPLTSEDYTWLCVRLSMLPYNQYNRASDAVLDSLTPELPSYRGVEEALHKEWLIDEQIAVYDALDKYSIALEENKLISASKLAQAKLLDSMHQAFDTVRRVQATNKIKKEVTTQFFNRLGIYETTKVLGAHNTPEALLEYMITHKTPWIQFEHNASAGYGYVLKPHMDSILNNQAAYEAVGLHVLKDEDTGLFYVMLDKDFNIEYGRSIDGYTVAWEYKGERYERTVDYLNNEAEWDFENLIEDSVTYKTNVKSKGEDGQEIVEFVEKTLTKEKLKPAFEAMTTVKEHISLLTNGASRGHINGILTEGAFNTSYAALPRKLRTVGITPDALTTANFWDGVVFDGIHLGGTVGRKIYGPVDYMAQLMKTAEQVVQHARYSNLYLDYLFSADTSVAELCTRLGDEEVFKLIQKHSEDYRIIFLKESPRSKGQLLYGGQGFAIHTVSVDNFKDLMYIKEHCPQAVLVPTSIASEMTTELTNTLLQNNPLFKAVRGFTYAVKVGLIMTTGKVMRDGFEGLTKNTLEVENIIKTAKGYKNAPQVIAQYRKAMEDILELSVVNRYGYQQMLANGIDPFEFAEIYLRNRTEAVELVTRYFDNIDDILKLDANKVYTDVNKKLYFELYGEQLGISEDLFDELHGLIFSHEAFDMPTGIGRKMLDWAFKPMAFMDQINRVAEYLALRELYTGSPLKAAGKVMATHFDAAVKSNAELITETFIPFFAFLKRNTIYWTKAMAEHPWLARLAADFMTHSMGPYHDYSEFELNNNTSLQAAMLNGAVAIGETESGDLLTFKLNIPFMSAYQMYRNPIGTLAESSSPVLQYLIHQFISSNPNVDRAVVDLMGGNRIYNFEETGENYAFDMRQLIPVIGPVLNKYGSDGYVSKQVEESSSKLLYLNSVFGRVKRFNTPQFNNANNYYRNNQQPTWRPTMSIAQYKYMTGQYSGSSYGKGGRASVYPKSYNQLRYEYRNRQHQRYYNNNALRWQAEYRRNQQQWANENRRDYRIQQARNKGRRAMPKMNWRVQQQIK